MFSRVQGGSRSARRLKISPVLAAALALGLASCSAASAGGDTAQEDPHPDTVTIETCGVASTFPETPGRIVTLKSSVTETAMALGAGDRLVGVAALDGALPAHVTGVDDAVWDLDPPIVADSVPSHEAVLELEPALVIAGWESNLSADGAGERTTFHSYGVGTYVSPSACRGEHAPTAALTFDDVFTEIELLGQAVGAADNAAAVVKAQRTALTALPELPATSALWYSSGSDTPYIGAGRGIPQLIMETAGLTNIADDVDDTWVSMSWEEVAQRDPSVIVLVDSEWNTAEHKIDVLESNPVTAALDAVRQQNYLVIPFAATESGVRNVDAVLDLVEQRQEAGL